MCLDIVAVSHCWEFEVVLRRGLLKICTCLYGGVHRNKGERGALMGSIPIPEEKAINAITFNDIFTQCNSRVLMTILQTTFNLEEVLRTMWARSSPKM